VTLKKQNVTFCYLYDAFFCLVMVIMSENLPSGNYHVFSKEEYSASLGSVYTWATYPSFPAF
jgi:hypothetical protein